MKSATGRWVSGDDFFDRERELQLLTTRLRDHNHVLLTGQRRMGKTSVVQELGRRLKDEGWIFLPADVEGAKDEEDAIADIAKAVHPVRPIASRLAAAMGSRFRDSVEEVGAYDFRMKIRAELDAGSWRRYGEQLLRDCATQDKPVLLAIDELPIFLKKMLSRYDDGAWRVDGFLSWLRGVLQSIEDGSLILIISGSIGLEPLVKRLGIPDRINHLFSFRLRPWDRDTSIACFDKLAESCQLRFEGDVANAVYDMLGVGIPHQVQSFFVRLYDHAIMQNRERVTVADVEEVYRTELLGPSGQSDLMHYETRLREGVEEESYPLVMKILAEAAIQEVFTSGAQRCLERMYSAVVDDAAERIMDALDILVHDGYLEADADGYRFPSRLLKDFWAARFRGHHRPLESR